MTPKKWKDVAKSPAVAEALKRFRETLRGLKKKGITVTITPGDRKEKTDER